MSEKTAENGNMSKLSKATDIPPSVKEKVWERDDHRCVICGSPYAQPNAHYIRRSHGGLGIEQNVVTLCLNCHNDFDNGRCREEYGEMIRDYLKSKYPNWNEADLVFRKD